MEAVRGRTAAGIAPEALALLALNELPQSSLLVFDTEFRYVVARGQALRRYGFEPSMMEGRLAPETLPPERWAMYSDAYRRAIEGESTEFTISSPDVSETYSVRVAPLRDATGAIVGGVSVATNVSAVIAAESQFRLLADNAMDVVLLTDPEGTVLWASPSVEVILGRRADDLVGTSAAGIVNAQDLGAARRRRAETPGIEDDSGVSRIRAADGSERWMSWRARGVRGADGSMQHVVVALRDVENEVRASQELAASELLFRTTMTSAPIGMFLTELDGTIILPNEAMCLLLMREPSWLVGRRLEDVADPAMWDELAESRNEVAAGDMVEPLVVRLTRADGAHVWVRRVASLIPAMPGHSARLLVQLVDVTAEHFEVEGLSHRAFHDDLTGLRNRAWLVDMLEVDLRSALRDATPVGVLMVDLDDFKIVNDSLGHAAGDEVLAQVGERLSAAVRPHDRVARLGGDEFAVVAPDVQDPQRLEVMAQRIIEELGRDFSIHGHRLRVGASVGIALSTRTSTVESLFRDADAALFRAKFDGRGRWHFADAHFHREALARMSIEEELRRAIIHHEFEVYYQPIVALTDGRVAGYEALVRWRHPARGLLLPEEFLPISETSGLIDRVEQQVLEAVCTVIAGSGGLPGPVSVNVSAPRLNEPLWASTFQETLDRHGIEARALAIEITEPVALALSESARESLRALSELGLGLHVDDFGTGFSSLSLLRDLPVTALKLDTSFVGDLARPTSAAQSVSAGLAGLARGMGVLGIAEGVQDEEQHRILVEHGWTHGQGRLYGAPAPWAPRE